VTEEGKKEKGLIVVTVPTSLHSKVGQYSDTRPSFALVSSPKEGRKQMTQLFTCRDFINDAMLSFYTNVHFGYNAEYPVKLDTSKLRLMIAGTGKVSDDEKKQKASAVYAAKRIINIYEKLAGFAPVSVVSRVDRFDETDKKKLTGGAAWLLTGPSEWMRVSQLVSMITLIFRVIWRTNTLPKEELKNINDVNAFFKQIVDSYGKSGYDSPLGEDRGYIPHYPKYEMFMAKYKELFGSLSIETLFPKGASGWHSNGGITALSRSSTGIRVLDEKVNGAWKTWREERNIEDIKTPGYY
jgi:hypothetical protein